jgi:hypothetical protein
VAKLTGKGFGENQQQSNFGENWDKELQHAIASLIGARGGLLIAIADRPAAQS